MFNLTYLLNIIRDAVIDNLDLLFKILSSLVVIILFYIVAGKIAHWIKHSSRISAPPEIILNISNTVKIIIILVGVMTALSILGVDLSGILLAAGFAGIVVGLAAQQTLGQFFSGLLLLLEGRIRNGEFIKIGDEWGVVESIGMFSTQIRLWTGEILTIPNNSLASSNIYSFTKINAKRIDFVIGISYSSDIEKAIRIIEETLWDQELVLAEPKPLVVVKELGDSSVNLRVMAWIPMEKYWDAQKRLIGEIKRRLEENGIEIPFPQRVVWLKRISEK